MKRFIVLLIACIFTSGINAATSPYPVDNDTLHLWHFDAQSNGVVLDMAPGTQLNLNLTNGAVIDDSETGFGKALYTYDGEESTQAYAGDSVNGVLVSDLTGDDGAFTFEAIVKPMVEQNAIPHDMEIISLEDNDGNTERGFQFRLNGNGQLRFQTIAGIIVSFDANISFSANNWYHAAVTYNGQENTADNIKLYWTELGNGSSANEVGSYQLNEDLKADVSSYFCIGNELRANGGYTENFEGMVDEVRISSTARSATDMINRSALPWTQSPSPATGTKLESLNSITELQWNSGDSDNITSYYLYFWKDEPNYANASPIAISDLTDPISAALPDTLVSDTLYFWRVDERFNNSTSDDASTVTGPVWVFETPPSIPVIVSQPKGVRVFETEPSAEIVCEFSSLSQPTVEWFKLGTETAISAGGDISISMSQDGNNYTSSLAITAPAVADEGKYYCKITNSADTVVSNEAYFIIKRLLAQYDFEGDLAPTAGEADVPTGIGKSLVGLEEPNELQATNITLSYESGYDGVGQAVVFGEGQYIDFSADGYPKVGAVDGGLGLGMDAGSLVCWVKPQNDGVLYQNFNDNSTMGINLSINESQDVVFYLRNNNSTQLASTSGMPDRPEWDLLDGQWHMLAFTWELGKSNTVYVDGQPVATNNTGNDAAFVEWQRSVVLGARRESSNRQMLFAELASAVDYLRIYNYKLDEESNDVFAQEYFDATGIVPCLDINFDGFQFNFDNTGGSYCKIDLADFAAFAASWLNGGLFDGQ